MTFMIYSLNGHERTPLEKLFKERVVETQSITAQRPIDERGHDDGSESHGRHPSGAHAYRMVEQLPTRPEVLLAGQVLTSPVVTLPPEATITEALQQFQANAFRHVPVVSSAARLVGIVSERDILRHLAGMTPGCQPQLPSTGDVRYIARLFVEQRIGAMPVVADGVLQGIITRSEVLGAVIAVLRMELRV